jgi:HEAT repeat protein
LDIDGGGMGAAAAAAVLAVVVAVVAMAAAAAAAMAPILAVAVAAVAATVTTVAAAAVVAAAKVSNEILPQLVYSLSEQNVQPDLPCRVLSRQCALQRFYKKAAAFVLRAVAKHSPQLAQAVVDSGALDALVGCLEELDPGVKEAAAWALGDIARHNGGVQTASLCISGWL